MPMFFKKTSVYGINLIKRFEGFRNKKYTCLGKNPTIGYGHSIKPDEQKNYFSGITEQQASCLLLKDLTQVEKAINSQVKVPLNTEQFDVLVSFIYNVGVGNFSRSNLLKELNAGHYDAVPTELKRWKYSKGEVVTGLLNRRQAEAELFELGTEYMTLAYEKELDEKELDEDFEDNNSEELSPTYLENTPTYYRII